MSATDTIRAMLDERGVEWTEPNNKARSHTTYWTAGFLRCIAVEFNDGMVSIASSSGDITPEQAVEATLGRGTCRMEKRHMDWRCTGCGEIVGTDDPTSELFIDGNAVELWRYCPNCGRKVRA